MPIKMCEMCGKELPGAEKNIACGEGKYCSKECYLKCSQEFYLKWNLKLPGNRWTHSSR